jgi:2,2-dialkylglycine decarboxylase (pyruvate)
MAAGHEGSSWLERARGVLVRSAAGEYVLPVIERAEGATIVDVDGREYLDFSSGQLCATVGHGHPRLIGAIERSSRRVIHLFSGMVSPEVVTLAERLIQLLPEPLRKILFLSTGGESTEAALRLAKKATSRHEVVSLADGFHGSTTGAASSTFIRTRRRGYGPAMPGTFAIPAPSCYRCPLGRTFPACDFECARVGFDLIDAQTTGSLAAVIAEPILGAAGIIDAPPGYLRRLKELCAEREMLLILDEAQTGLGRLGDTWGFERDDTVPDILAMSKTLGGGIPLSAVVTSKDLEDAAFRMGFWFYTSHLNDPLPASVGITVLDILRDENLVEAARMKGEYLKKRLLELQEGREIIGDVRGRGLLLGVDLVRDRVTKQPAGEAGWRITRRCLEAGLFLAPISQPGRYFVWRVAPPLTVAYDEIDRAVEIIEAAIRAE